MTRSFFGPCLSKQLPGTLPCYYFSSELWWHWWFCEVTSVKCHLLFKRCYLEIILTLWKWIKEWNRFITVGDIFLIKELLQSKSRERQLEKKVFYWSHEHSVLVSIKLRKEWKKFAFAALTTIFILLKGTSKKSQKSAFINVIFTVKYLLAILQRKFQPSKFELPLTFK